MKNCFRSILICIVTFVPAASMRVHAHTTTSYGEWFMASPSLQNDTMNPTAITRQKGMLYTENLRKLGQKASEKWEAKKDNRDAIEKLQKIFAAVDQKYLIAYIDEVVKDDAQLEAIAKASYRNVTGFWKIVLAASDADGGWKIRLHIWEQQEEKEFPHNHKWDFYSKIICGYLAQDLYSKSSECDISSAHSIRQPVSLMPTLSDGKAPCPCRDHYILDPKEGVTDSTVSLRNNATHYIGAGESYFMPHHLIHSIDPSERAISLVFTTDRVTENSEVFVPEEMVSTDLSRFAPSISIAELKEKLLSIKGQLQQLQLNKRYLPEMVDLQHRYFDVNNDDVICSVSNWRTMVDDQSGVRKRVMQLSNQEMENYIVSVSDDGKVLIGGEPVNPSDEYIFVLQNDRMYAASKDFHHEQEQFLCHTSFSKYAPVDSAGVFVFAADGSLREIEAYSGHYLPSVEDMQRAHSYLRSIGIDVSSAVCSPYKDRIQKRDV